ncbi:hypothetical protein CAPTEDRAFT_213590 [Capitella teleta]|uniref:Uncharacterized protein n=1 Tax=Capitella teleta TaxID=283909 RepID=R7VK10_CAPTE|nr:hypothetical protein CAPTEDRAFT_213590 [Capitella teleta]|eukprot:ELU16375.1 hypothetical protein CAPTEDRAFT_213590 [Capitella teleta]
MNVGQLSASELKRKSDEATRGRGRTNVQGQLPANLSINYDEQNHYSAPYVAAGLVPNMTAMSIQDTVAYLAVPNIAAYAAPCMSTTSAPRLATGHVTNVAATCMPHLASFHNMAPTFAPSMATTPASCTTATFDRNMSAQFDHNMNSVATPSKPFPNIDAAPFLPRIAAATSAPNIAPSAVPHLATTDVLNMGAIANTPAAKFDPRVNLYEDVPDDIPAGCVVTVAREHHGTIYYNRYTT